MATAMDVIIPCAPTVLLWLLWYARLWSVTTLASSHWDRLPAYASPVLCVGVLMLRIAAVVDESPLKWWLVNAETAVLGPMSLALPWLGLSPWGDVAERRNRAAAIAIVGAMIGLSLACGGAAVAAARMMPHGEDGTPFFAVLLGIAGSVVFFVLAIAVETLAHLSEAVTIDRDGGAALRLAGLLTGLGLIIGQALEALPDGSRLLATIAVPQIFAAGALALELVVRRRPRFGGPRVADGIMAILYLGAAGCATWLLQ